MEPSRSTPNHALAITIKQTVINYTFLHPSQLLYMQFMHVTKYIANEPFILSAICTSRSTGVHQLFTTHCIVTAFPIIVFHGV